MRERTETEGRGKGGVAAQTRFDEIKNWGAWGVLQAERNVPSISSSSDNEGAPRWLGGVKEPLGRQTARGHLGAEVVAEPSGARKVGVEPLLGVLEVALQRPQRDSK
jgi:hypothetical protein